MIDTERVNSQLLKITQGKVPVHLRAKVDSDDFVQESWTRLLRNDDCDRFSNRSRPEVSRYLMDTVDSVVLDQTRRYDRTKRKATRERPLPSAGDGSSTGMGICLVADQSSPSRKLSREELAGHLKAAIEALPDDQRLAIKFHHVEDMSLEETAALMGRSKASVAGLLRRGLKDLRHRLEGLGDA